jgi:hypothetical protein
MLWLIFQIIILGLFSIHPLKEYCSDQQQDDGYEILKQGTYALQKNHYPRIGQTLLIIVR